jgi:hypothetical protein
MENMHAIAIGEDNPNYFDHVISNNVINHYRKIKNFLHKEWKDKNKQKSLLEIRGCLDKFSSIIFQINRLNNHQNGLLNISLLSRYLMLPILQSLVIAVFVFLTAVLAMAQL